MKKIQLLNLFSACLSVCTIMMPSEMAFAQVTNYTLAEMRQKANKGDAGAMVDLGICNIEGRGVGTNYVEAVVWFRKAAVLGNAQAMYSLGKCYEEGVGVSPDPSEAVKWYRKAIDIGNADAMEALGNCYNSGTGVSFDQDEAMRWWCKAAELGGSNTWLMVQLGIHYELGSTVLRRPPNHAEAVKWYRKAADLGDSKAMVYLGQSFDRGTGKDTAEAIRWFTKAAGLKNTDAMLLLGDRYYIGDGVEKSEVEALKWYGNAAELGDYKAMFFLGCCYETGVSVKKDHDAAREWYRKAAEMGHAESMFKLGLFYESDDYESKNEKDALLWYRKASALDHADAMAHLGILYEAGRGLKTNVLEAVKLYRKAAHLGSAQGKANLAACYVKGCGIAQNNQEAANLYNEAAKYGSMSREGALGVYHGGYFGVGSRKFDANVLFDWWRKAADLGNSDAMVILGMCYERGNAVIPKDDYQALNWYQKAADSGNANGMAMLAQYYSSGVGVPQNDVYAYMWASLAAAKNSIWASNRNQMRSRLTPEQVAEAQKMATSYSEQKAWLSRGEQRGGDKISSAPISKGSGFFVTPDGYLITAHHVVAKAKTYKINLNGKILEAKLIKADAANDMALLKVDGRFSSLQVISSRDVKLGAGVFTIGFPNVDIQGSAAKLTQGNINSLSGILDDPRSFQINVPIQPGNSGGPLLDKSGNVVGVVVSQLDAVKTTLITGSLPQGVNYAVKSSYVLPLLESIQPSPIPVSEAKKNSIDDAIKVAEAAVCMVLSYE